jgi:hypothetical protein
MLARKARYAGYARYDWYAGYEEPEISQLLLERKSRPAFARSLYQSYLAYLVYPVTRIAISRFVVSPPAVAAISMR